MKTLNTYQKIIIVLAIVVFLLVTSSSIFLAFFNKKTTDQENQTKSTGEIIVKVKVNEGDKEVEEKRYSENEMINVPEGVILLEVDSTLTLVANAPFQATYENSTLNIISGVSYLEPKSDLNLLVSNGELKLNENIRAIYNPSEDSLIILSGELSYNINQTASINEYLTWEVDSFGKYSFKRNLLSDNNFFSNLLNGIQLVYNLPLELTDLIPPFLEIDTPENNSTVSTDIVLFSLSTEKQSVVTINDQTLRVDDEGMASMPFPLVLGKNPFEITAKDMFGNESKETIIVFREEKSESPVSYPEE